MTEARFHMLTAAQQRNCAWRAVSETTYSDHTLLGHVDEIDLVGMTIAKALDEAAARMDAARCSVPAGWQGVANQR